MPKNIFVIGLDPFHLQMMQCIHHAEGYTFHGLLNYEEVITPLDYPFQEMLDQARQQLAAFPGTVDGIIVHWDFPASTMLPLLCAERGLRSASMESVLKCEHKYWARLEQQRIVPDFTPGFAAVNPFDPKALEKLPLPLPFWLKPVKAFASYLGFRIDTQEEFEAAMGQIRTNIRRIGDPFNVALSYVDLPPEIKDIDGNWCIAEEIVSGKQCGIEGFMFEGQVAVHGVVDCVKDARNQSFTRYEYPSVWPESVQQRMKDASARLFQHIGFDNSPFGVEFFWDEATDKLTLLEVNTRISQSHSDQFIKVEGVSNHEVAVDIALGRQPEIGRKAGKYRTAAKFLLRKYADAHVRRVPTDQEIAALESEFQDSIIKILVQPGARLSDLRDQDSYSFEIANIFLGAQNQDELVEKYQNLAKRLCFEFSDHEPPEQLQFEKIRY
ncbi:MAG: ATP-grasp domain-containing protein [Desulfurivibrionaceae bacterium]|nr:ATP-grasp domain-containing protein [Desulfurivibrionaceae bacterium]